MVECEKRLGEGGKVGKRGGWDPKTEWDGGEDWGDCGKGIGKGEKGGMEPQN